jgi:hypothetical protein
MKKKLLFNIDTLVGCGQVKDVAQIMKCRCDMEGPGKRRSLIKDIDEKVIINFPINFFHNRNFFSLDRLRCSVL